MKPHEHRNRDTERQRDFNERKDDRSIRYNDKDRNDRYTDREHRFHTNRHTERDIDRERDRYTERNRDKDIERDTDTYRERDRYTERSRGKDIERSRDKDIERNRDKDIERDTDRERDRYTERKRDKDIERDTDRSTERNRDKDIERDTDRYTERNRDKDIERGTDRYTERNRDKDIERDTDRERNRYTERNRDKDIERDTDRERDRYTERNRDNYRRNDDYDRYNNRRDYSSDRYSHKWSDQYRNSDRDYQGRDYNNRRYSDGGYNQSQQGSSNQLQPDPDVEKIFEKIASIVLETTPDPPSVEVFFTSSPWEKSELIQLKTSLNTTKDKLNDKDISLWGNHTKNTFAAGSVVFVLRKEINPEGLSGAWAKMYEIHAKYNLIKPKDNIINTAHLCEAPGGFICATNHYVRSEFPEAKWNWFGLSLNPYQEGNDLGAMIDDDRLIIRTWDCWYFGADNSGNIMHKENIVSTWAHAVEMARRDTTHHEDDNLNRGYLDLVTADGSIDSQHDPNNQESLTAFLHYCESVCALGLLCIGGSFVLKMFTLFEHSTVCITYLLSIFFKKVEIFKPATSKSGNSEVYIICMEFKGISNSYLETLLSKVGGNDPFVNNAMFPLDTISPEFMQKFIEAATIFMKEQQDTIEKNLATETKQSDYKWKQQTWANRNWVSREWIKRMHVKRISDSQKIDPLNHVQFVGSESTKGFSQQGNKSGGTLKSRQVNHEKRKRQRREMEEKNDSPNEPPRKIQKIEGEKEDLEEKKDRESTGKDQTKEEGKEDQTEKENNNSEPAAEYSTFAQRLMSKMGHKEGLGLGARNQGRADPIQLDLHNQREGLGYGSTSFDRFDSIVKTAMSSSHGFMKEEIKKWKIKQGPTIPIVFVSRFCGNTSVQLLSQLYEKRKRLEHILNNPEKLRELSEFLWPSAISDHLGYLTPEGLTLAALDHHCLITRELKFLTAPIKFVDLGSREGGGVEYLLHKLKGKAISGITATKMDVSRSKKLGGDTEAVAGIKVLPELAEVKQNLQIEKAIEVIQNFAGKYKNGEGVNLFVGDLSGMETEEPSFNHQLLSEILIGLCTLQKQGTMVCRTWSNHRISEGGLLYVLYCSFKKIFYIKPFTSSPLVPERFLVCQHLLTQPHEALVQFLKEANTRARELKGTKFDVLEVIPPPIFMNSHLREVVALANAELVQREMFGLECLEMGMGKMEPGQIREQVCKILKE